MQKYFNTNNFLYASGEINDNTNLFKISVIITTYNTANYLPVCIDSVLNNTYKNLEVLLVDDDSVDNTLEICEQYASNDARIKIITQKNSGVSSARNNGLLQASGDAVHFVDGDDYITKDFYALMAAIMQRDASDMVCCTYYNERRGMIDAPLTLSHVGLLGKLSVIDGWLKGVCCMLFRTAFLRDNLELRFDTNFSYGEDIIFLVKTVYFAQKISGMPDAVYYHRFNPSSVTNVPRTEEKNEIMREQALNVGEILETFAKEKQIPEEIWETHKNNNNLLQMKYYKDVVENFHKTDEIISCQESHHSNFFIKYLAKLICLFIPISKYRKQVRKMLLSGGKN